jgi:ribonuclease VapC
MSRYVFDSFAILAYVQDEPGGTYVAELLRGRDECLMSVVNIGEVYYATAKKFDMDTATNVLDDVLRLPIQFVTTGLSMALSAARIKAQYPLSYADAFVAALAQRYDAAIVTGDPEFERLERDDVARVEWLPPRRRRRR